MGIATLIVNLRAAFREKLLTVPSLPAARAWEGVTYNPADGVAYVSEAFRSLSQRRLSVGNANGTGGVIEHTLMGAATLFYPHNKGTLDLETMAGAIAANFLPGQSLVRGGDKGSIQNVEISQLYRDGERIACAITITLLAHTQA